MSYQMLLFDFHGRIGRKWFWITTLFLLVFPFAWGFAMAWLLDFRPWKIRSVSDLVLVLINGILLVFYCVATAAVQVKRWHDRNKTGWWILFQFLPAVGMIWTFVETGFVRGTDGPNRYGPDPRVDPRAALDGV